MEETAQVEAEVLKKIHNSVGEAGHSVETVVPTTSDSPLPINMDDVKNAAGDVKDSLLGGSVARQNPSRGWLDRLRQRVYRKAKPDEQVTELPQSGVNREGSLPKAA